MTQGKIERWHQTLKNRILLDNYYLPGDLEAQIEAFVAERRKIFTARTIAPWGIRQTCDFGYGKPTL